MINQFVLITILFRSIGKEGRRRAQDIPIQTKTVTLSSALTPLFDNSSLKNNFVDKKVNNNIEILITILIGKSTDKKL